MCSCYTFGIESIAILFVESDNKARVDDGFEFLNGIDVSFEIYFDLLVGYLYRYVEPPLFLCYTEREVMLLSQEVYTRLHVFGEVVVEWRV